MQREFIKGESWNLFLGLRAQGRGIGMTITEEEVVAEVWIGMIVIDTVVEIEILTIEAGVAVTALITIEAVVEIDTMMKGDIGAVPLLQDEVTVCDGVSLHAEVFRHVGVLHLVRAVRLAVHHVQGVQVLLIAALMDVQLVITVRHLLRMFHHAGLLARGVHLLANQMMSKFSATWAGVMSSIAGVELSQLSRDNVEVSVLVHH